MGPLFLLLAKLFFLANLALEDPQQESESDADLVIHNIVNIIMVKVPVVD